MEGEHVRKAADSWPEAFPKVIPLSEAVYTANNMGVGQIQLGDLVGRINQVRDPMTYLRDDWDVEDPYKRRMKHYRKAVKEIDGLIEGLFSRLV